MIFGKIILKNLTLTECEHFPSARGGSSHCSSPLLTSYPVHQQHSIRLFHPFYVTPLVAF